MPEVRDERKIGNKFKEKGLGPKKALKLDMESRLRTPKLKFLL